MNTLQSLQHYLDTYFPNLELCKPLFYNAPIGIRFEIGNPDITVENGYMEQVYYRSIELFKETHRNSDEIFLVVNVHRSIGLTNLKFKRVKVFNYIKDRQKLYKLNIEVFPYIYDKDEKENVPYRYVLKCRVSDIKYVNLLKAIGNQDMGINPRIFDECFFINVNNKTIFHFYDDRGLDIVASQKESLQKIYKIYNNWILDYDRERIDQIFK
jgi:hypothetical protein